MPVFRQNNYLAAYHCDSVRNRPACYVANMYLLFFPKGSAAANKQRKLIKSHAGIHYIPIAILHTTAPRRIIHGTGKGGGGGHGPCHNSLNGRLTKD
jgi:hypothetical protein